MAIIAGNHVRIMLGGIDISRLVRAASVTAEVNAVVTTHLDLICGVSFVDGVLSLGGPPAVSPLAAEDHGETVLIRGITFGKPG